jgi:hypothetical protein
MRRLSDDTAMLMAGTATAVASSTSAWFALGGALGGVLLTSAVGLATVVLNHRWQTGAADQQLLSDHVGRLRQERRETYRDYWSAWNRLTHQLREIARQASASTSASVNASTLKEAQDAELGWRDAADALFLIGGSEVVAAAEEHAHATDSRIEAARQGIWESGRGTYMRLNEAMRRDIIELPRPGQ